MWGFPKNRGQYSQEYSISGVPLFMQTSMTAMIWVQGLMRVCRVKGLLGLRFRKEFVVD